MNDKDVKVIQAIGGQTSGAAKGQADDVDQKTAEMSAKEALDAAINHVRSAEIGLVQAAHSFARARQLESVRIAVRSGSDLSRIAEHLEEYINTLGCL